MLMTMKIRKLNHFVIQEDFNHEENLDASRKE